MQVLHGVSAYFRNGDTTSQDFANLIVGRVSSAMGLTNNGVLDDSTSNNGQLDSIGNSAEYGFPSILVEGGFMSNTNDMAVIGEEGEEGLKKYAAGIAIGILNYYGIENVGLDTSNIVNRTTTTTSKINSRIYDLRYVAPDVLDRYVQSDNQSERRKALYCYTLEPETKKLVVANWSFTTENGIEIKKSQPINYRSVLNKYTMPIEYMIDFLVHTDDAKMVGKLVDLAIDTEYIIAVQDNVTTIQTTEDMQQKTYKLILNPITREYYTTQYVDWHSISTNVTVKETVTNEIELTYADSWFVRFSKTSSYANIDENGSIEDRLIGDQGESLGNFQISTYCSACHQDENGNLGSTATTSGREATENLTIAVSPSVFNNAGSNLSNGDYVMINNRVYRVDDTGAELRPEDWIGIYIKADRGSCKCSESSLNSEATPVYKVENVREMTQNDIEEYNQYLTGVNAITNEEGEVTDTTTIMEETLGTVNSPTQYRGVWNVTENKKITTVRVISNKYDSGIDNIESTEQKFIDVFLSSTRILSRFNMDWMEVLLSQNERTVNMIDLTKYLYTKAKEYDANIQNDEERYNFDVYKRNDLYHIYGSTSIEEEFIKSLENNALRLYMSNHTSIDEGAIEDYITQDPDEPAYKMLTNSYGGRGFGFNIFHRLNETDWNSGRPLEDRVVEHYNNLGFDITPYVNTDMTLETEIVDQVMRAEIKKWKDVIEEQMANAGIALEENQINALTVIAYQYGWSQNDTQSFLHAYQTYYENENKEAFKTNFSIAQGTVQPFHSPYRPSDEADLTKEERKEKINTELTWHLFETGEYKTPEGEVLYPDSFHGGNGEFLNVAFEIWQEVCERFTTYGATGDIPVPDSSTIIDCSGYVSWVLYEYGVATGNDAIAAEFQGHQKTTETLKDVNWDQLGFDVIEVAVGQDVRGILQPGDILDRSTGNGADGHVQIIVEITEDGQVYAYDCGDAPNWTNNSNAEPIVSNFAENGKPGIIIRKR